MKSICGTNCEECSLYNNKCKGCIESKACPFGKKCFIGKLIEIGGKDNFQKFKEKLINEINSLNIEIVPKIDELYPLNGSLVNLEYTLPNGNKEKILNDDEIYLGNQVECIFNDKEIKKYVGIVANMSIILVCEYEENSLNNELLLYKKR